MRSTIYNCILLLTLFGLIQARNPVQNGRKTYRNKRKLTSKTPKAPGSKEPTTTKAPKAPKAPSASIAPTRSAAPSISNYPSSITPSASPSKTQTPSISVFPSTSPKPSEPAVNATRSSFTSESDTVQISTLAALILASVAIYLM